MAHINEEKMDFRNELEGLINKHSLENASSTPDFILAHYLINCLKAFDDAVNFRTTFYSSPAGGRMPPKVTT
jgi:hypothetical protein